LRLISRPLPLAAVALLLLNDHWLKGSGLLPGAVTGKLSDVAGLFFFPVLCFAVTRGKIPATLWAAATGVVFSAAKVCPPFNQWLTTWWGPVAPDLTDLAALAVLPLSTLWLRQAARQPAQPSPRLELAAVIVAALASMATQPSRVERNFPAWAVDADPELETGCLTAKIWVAKSGKQGMGASLRVRARGEASCQVEILNAQLSIAGATIEASGLPVRKTVAGAEEAHVYLPFAFDNERMWNSGRRTGELVIQLRLNIGAVVRWRLPMIHRLNQFHIDRSREER
jgi:hypothetical protein